MDVPDLVTGDSEPSSGPVTGAPAPRVSERGCVMISSCGPMRGPIFGVKRQAPMS